jgi:hypothetical protein
LALLMAMPMVWPSGWQTGLQWVQLSALQMGLPMVHLLVWQTAPKTVHLMATPKARLMERRLARHWEQRWGVRSAHSMASQSARLKEGL